MCRICSLGVRRSSSSTPMKSSSRRSCRHASQGSPPVRDEQQPGPGSPLGHHSSTPTRCGPQPPPSPSSSTRRSPTPLPPFCSFPLRLPLNLRRPGGASDPFPTLPPALPTWSAPTAAAQDSRSRRTRPPTPPRARTLLLRRHLFPLPHSTTPATPSQSGSERGWAQ